MQAMLYLERMDEPVSILDEVSVVEFGTSNHSEDSQLRLFYRTKSLNATRTMLELHRDRKLTVRMEDGRTADALLVHSSLDSQGNAVGVLRLLGALA